MSLPSSSRTLVPPADWLKPPAAETSALGPGFLLLVTLLAAALRLYSLTGQSLWVDEIMSWQAIRPGAGLHFFEQITDAIQGPLYLALTWPLLRLADTPLMLRILPALAGIVTVPLFAVTLQRMFEARTARLGALLLAINPFHVWYSQEGRGYSFLMLLAVLMGYVLWRLVNENPRWSLALGLALAGTGAMLSNLSGLFLLLAMGLTVLIWDFPRRARTWGLLAVAFGGALLLAAPWLLKASGIWAVDRLVVGNATGEALRGETTFTPLALPYSIFTYFFGYSLGPSLRELHAPDKMQVLWSWLPLLATAAFPVGAGLLSGLVHLRRRQWALVFWILIPLAILVVLALRNVKPWNPRYVAVVMPWLLALGTLGLMRLPRLWGGLASVLLVGLTLFSLGGHYWDTRYAKADVRQAASAVMSLDEEQAGIAAPIMVPVVTGVFHYYYGGEREVIGTFGLGALANAAGAAAFCDSTLAGRDGLLWVEARPWFFDPQGLLPDQLARRGHLRLIDQWPGAKLYSWQRPEEGKAEDGN